MTQKEPRRDRVTPFGARCFAGKVHSSQEPVLFRLYPDRPTANARCWEWNRKRPIFEGLGIEFFVKLYQDPKAGQSFGIFARPLENSTDFVLMNKQHGPLLKLQREAK